MTVGWKAVVVGGRAVVLAPAEQLVVFAGNVIQAYYWIQDAGLRADQVDPFKGMWALPGGHVEANETSRDAAAREGAEETGVTVLAEDLALVGVFDTPGRDPRGRYVTVAWFGFLAGMPLPTAGDDAHAPQWVPVAPMLTGHLAFDHRRILRKAFTLFLTEGNTSTDAHL
jgi:8-oxo-dGTP diphosphatase